jgi:Arc/MetJ family transcription regulator
VATEKVSMTLDADVLAKARERVGGRGVSGYVNAAVRRQLRRDALSDLLAELEASNGAPDPTAMEEVRRLWPGLDGGAAVSRPALAIYSSSTPMR